MNTQLFLDFNLDPEATVQIVKIIVGGLSATAIFISFMKFFVGTFLRKYINDNTPSLAQADINARNKVRWEKLKYKFNSIMFSLTVGLSILILILHNAGIIKLKENTALMLAVITLGAIIIDNLDWKNMKSTEVTDVDEEMEKDFKKFMDKHKTPDK